MKAKTFDRKSNESMVPPSGAAQVVIRNGLRLLGVASRDTV
jgi:hypothetical protein